MASLLMAIFCFVVGTYVHRGKITSVLRCFHIMLTGPSWLSLGETMDKLGEGNLVSYLVKLTQECCRYRTSCYSVSPQRCEISPSRNDWFQAAFLLLDVLSHQRSHYQTFLYTRAEGQSENSIVKFTLLWWMQLMLRGSRCAGPRPGK